MNQERLLKIILSPHISEKSTIVTVENNEYVFRVLTSANKAEVKDAVELLFNVTVKAVHIVNVRPKKKLFRGREGTKKSWKKAYVKLAAGQKIDMIGSQQ